MRCELLHQKIGEDFDPLRSRPPGRRYPIHGARWERPIRQQSLKPSGGECVAQNELRQDTDAGAGDPWLAATILVPYNPTGVWIDSVAP